MAREWYDTVANIVGDATVELGLKSTAIADPYGSTDPNILQLLALLKSLGQDLVRDHPWQALETTHTFATVSGTAAYDPPAGFGRMRNQTEWDRTGQTPLLGPVSGVGWQLLKAQTSTGTVEFLMRVFNDQLNLHPTPTSIKTIAFEYISRYWVRATASSAPDKEAPTVASDVIHLDRRMVVAGLKWKWKREKGFDSAAADQDFRDAYGRAQSMDGSAPTLDTVSPQLHFGRMLDQSNMPDTNYGS